MRKRKLKKSNKAPKLPFFILFVIVLLLIGVLQTNQYVPVYQQLGELAICFWAIYIMILLFDFINKMVHKIPEQKERVVKFKKGTLIAIEVIYITADLFYSGDCNKFVFL